MSTGAVDRVNDTAATAQQQKTRNQNKSSSKSDLFATLVQGQVPSNIVFTRVDKHLDVPKTAKTNDDAVPVTPAREERAESEADPVETYETSATHETAAPKRKDAEPKQAQDGAQNGQPEATSETDAAAAETTADDTGADNNSATDAAPAAGQTAQVQTDPGDTVAKAATADASAVKQAASNNNAAGKPQDVNTDAKAQSNIAGQDTDLAQKAANAAKGKVNKTEQAVAKPNTALTSETTVTAQSAVAQNTKPVRAGEGRPTATQLANAASDSETQAPSANGLARANANGAAAKGAEKSGGANQAGNNANANSAASQNPAATAFDQMMANAAAAQNTSGAQATNATPQTVGSAAADPLTGAGTVQNAQANSAARAAAQAAAASKPKVPPQVVTEQVAVNINRAAGQGLDRISIQMRPSELGKVDVKMEVAHDGRVTAVITVERQETFDMLRADSRALTQALQDAGLQADQNSLSFNLQGQGSGTAQGGNGSGNGNGTGNAAAEGEQAEGDDLLGFGETAQADADGHYDVRV